MHKPYTVAELIAELQTFPPELPVIIQTFNVEWSAVDMEPNFELRLCYDGVHIVTW